MKGIKFRLMILKTRNKILKSFQKNIDDLRSIAASQRDVAMKAKQEAEIKEQISIECQKEAETCENIALKIEKLVS